MSDKKNNLKEIQKKIEATNVQMSKRRALVLDNTARRNAFYQSNKGNTADKKSLYMDPNLLSSLDDISK